MANVSTIISLIGFYDNFEEPEPVWNRPATLIGIAVPFLTLSWISVACRLYTRWRIIYAPGWDDLAVILFLITGTANAVGLLVASHYGLGQHLLKLSTENFVVFLKSYYVANASYASSTALIKISLLFQYLRIFEHGAIRKFCIAMVIFVGLWGLAYSILSWFPCSPISGYWDWKADNHCWAFASLEPHQFFGAYASHAVTNMVLDFIVLAIPMPLLIHEKSTRGTRRRLMMLLVAGSLVSGISIWRLEAILQHRAATWPTFDPTWYGPSVVILGMMEVNAASICACVPVFWPVLSARLDNIFVTQEVEITREFRFGERLDDEVQLRDDPGHRSGARRGDRRHRSTDLASQIELHKTFSSTKPSHYLDDYVMDQVDPLRHKKSAGIASITVDRKM